MRWCDSHGAVWRAEPWGITSSRFGESRKAFLGSKTQAWKFSVILVSLLFLTILIQILQQISFLLQYIQRIQPLLALPFYHSGPDGPHPFLEFCNCSPVAHPASTLPLNVRHNLNELAEFYIPFRRPKAFHDFPALQHLSRSLFDRNSSMLSFAAWTSALPSFSSLNTLSVPSPHKLCTC